MVNATAPSSATASCSSARSSDLWTRRSLLSSIQLSRAPIRRTTSAFWSAWLRALAETGDYGPTESGMFEIGYLHRGIEKLSENRNWTQIVLLTDRMDYVAAATNNVGYCETVEKLKAEGHDRIVVLPEGGVVFVELKAADRRGVPGRQIVPRPPGAQRLIVERVVVADDAAVDRVVAEVLPEDKAGYVKRLQMPFFYVAGNHDLAAIGRLFARLTENHSLCR